MRRRTIEGDLYECESLEWVVSATVMGICKPERDDVPRICEPGEEFNFAESLQDKAPDGTKAVELIEHGSDFYFERPVTNPDDIIGYSPRSDWPFILSDPDGDDTAFEIIKRIEFSALDLDELGDLHTPDEAGLLVDPSGGAHATLLSESEVTGAVEAGHISECVPARLSDRYL